jgi:hypothetical protein
MAGESLVSKPFSVATPATDQVLDSIENRGANFDHDMDMRFLPISSKPRFEFAKSRDSCRKRSISLVTFLILDYTDYIF